MHDSSRWPEEHHRPRLDDLSVGLGVAKGCRPQSSPGLLHPSRICREFMLDPYQAQPSHWLSEPCQVSLRSLRHIFGNCTNATLQHTQYHVPVSTARGADDSGSAPNALTRAHKQLPQRNPSGEAAHPELAAPKHPQKKTGSSRGQAPSATTIMQTCRSTSIE